MQINPTIADIELEKNVISRVLFHTLSANVGKISDEDSNELIFALDALHVDAGSFFSVSFYDDIFRFIHKKFCENVYPNPWDITNHLQKLPKYKHRQATIQHDLIGLLDNIEGCLYTLNQTPLSQLCTRLIENTKLRLLNSAIHKGVSSSDEIHSLKELINDIESPTSKREKVEKTLIKFRTASDPITKIESKRAMRMMGFSPQEVAEVTDNFVPPRPVPVITSALDFLNKKFSDATWIYPGLIRAGVVNLVTGQGGAGKTGFCYSAMLSFLAGKDFIGESPSILANNPNNRGLIINADQPPVDAQEMLKGNPLAWKLAREGKYNMLESEWCLGDILHLEMLLKEGVFNFIVIDSYKAIHNHIFGWDENHPSASSGIRELQRLCSVYGCTMLLIHHAGTTEAKGRHKSRGHSSIPDAASSVLSLTASMIERDKPGDPDIRFLEISKTRNSGRTNLAIKFNSMTYDYELLPNSEGQDRLRINTLANNLMIEFRNRYPRQLSTDELLKKVNGVNDRKSSLTKALQKLEQRGLIEKTVDETSNEFLYNMITKPQLKGLTPPKSKELVSPIDDFNDF
jgi:hypothetical protein